MNKVVDATSMMLDRIDTTDKRVENISSANESGNPGLQPHTPNSNRKNNGNPIAGELSKNNKFFQALYIFFVIEKSKTVVRPSK